MTTTLLATAKKMELVQFKQVGDRKQLKKQHVAFSGSLLHHPHDHDKVILLADPYSCNNIFYEFKSDDIHCVEKLPNVVNPEGEDIAMVMVWVKKGSIAVRSSAFIVEDMQKPK